LQGDAFVIEALSLALCASTATGALALYSSGKAIGRRNGHRRGWHSHHLIGYPVGFLFMEIARSIHFQFCLQALSDLLVSVRRVNPNLAGDQICIQPRRQSPQHSLIADGSLHFKQWLPGIRSVEILLPGSVPPI
jgi:hypothetical protein